MSAESTKAGVFGVLAEFAGPADLLHAAEKVRERGLKHWDCHSPFPVHGLDKAMGLGRSPVGLIAGAMALAGFCVGLGLQWWTSAVDYPLVISGKPFFSYPAFVPVTFGLTVLGGALGAFFGMLHLNKLPRPHHELFNSDEFANRVNDDAFFISIETSDGSMSPDEATQFLESIGATRVEVVSE
jgi:hypothetical protein